MPVKKVPIDQIDLVEEWNAYLNQRFGGTMQGFRDHLRRLVTDPDLVDQVACCTWCRNPALDTVPIVGNPVCTGCRTACAECDAMILRAAAHTVDGQTLCDECYQENRFYCEDCEEWVLNEDASDHAHGRCECASPALSFTVRNNGHDPLPNDTRTTVPLPKGVLSDEGVGAIASYLRRYAQMLYGSGDLTHEEAARWTTVANSLSELGVRWQARDGNYPKRLSRFAYNAYGVKLPEEVMSQVGNIGREHSKGRDFTVAVTRDLNQSAEFFCNEGSCWFGSGEYARSRCTLKSNGGFALLDFGEGEDWPQGRAWVWPLRHRDGRRDRRAFTPTFHADSADAFVVFNGYDTLTEWVPARIWAHMAGMTYRKLRAFSADYVYVNAGTGYLVAPEEIASRYTEDGVITLVVTPHADLYESEQVQESLTQVKEGFTDAMTPTWTPLATANGYTFYTTFDPFDSFSTPTTGANDAF